MTSREPERSRSWARYLWSLISQKTSEVDGRFKLTTYRKPHIASPMVTWLMTSRDPKRSRLWAQNLSTSLLLSKISWLVFWTQLKTDRMHHNIRGVKMTPTSRRRNKIGLPVEGLNRKQQLQKPGNVRMCIHGRPQDFFSREGIHNSPSLIPSLHITPLPIPFPSGPSP